MRRLPWLSLYAIPPFLLGGWFLVDGLLHNGLHEFYSGILNNAPLTHAARLVVCGAFFCLVGVVIACLSRWQHRQHQRFEAALSHNEPHPPLATPQPTEVPLNGARNPQVHITLRPRMLMVLHHTILAMALICGVLTIPVLLSGHTLHQFLVIVLPGLVLAGFPIVVTIFLLAASQEIWVDHRGMKVVSGYRSIPQVVTWDEIRFFALVGTGRAGDPPTAYSLVGTTHSLVWSRIQRWPVPLLSLNPATATRPSRNDMSRTEPDNAGIWNVYEHQMALLLAIISMNTKLLLYDLRPNHS
jgi:hypothetical protein